MANPENMFEKITENIVERMGQYTDSRQPTDDEVRIAWLVDEVDRLRIEVIDLENTLYALQEN